MTTTTTAADLSVNTMMEDARRLAEEVAERAAEIEEARRVPPDVLDRLQHAGCFATLLPRTHGGAEASLREALELFQVLAAGDASTGWIVMIGASGWCDLAALPQRTFDAIFAPGERVIVAGAIAPSGSISPTDGGFELTGRWGFASGCEHATHVFANAVEGFADGHPLMRVSVLDAADVAIEDTWDAVGLRGSGSHHFNVSGAIVPPKRTFVPLSDPPQLDAAIVQIPTPTVFALGVAAVAVGAARGALTTVTDLAQGKVPLLARGVLATDPLFQHGLSRADTGLLAADALLADVADLLWRAATTDASVAVELRGTARAAAAWAVDVAVRATEFAYRAAGGTAVYTGCSLQRRLRDVEAMAQHFLVRPDTFVATGSVLAGQGVPVPIF